MNLKIAFFGTPTYVRPIKNKLAQHFNLVDSLKKADLAVVAAYGKILTQEELNTPKFGIINVHPSLLPKYRGPSPIQTAILNGDKTSGITIIKMDEKVDHGPIIYQEPLELSSSDNFDTLSKKMFLMSAKILPDVIQDFIKEKIKQRLQRHAIATYCNLLNKNSGYFDINNPPDPQTLDRIVRAYYPWPGVWTKWINKIVKFLPIRSTDRPASSLPGQTYHGRSKFVHQRNKFLIQMEGKKVLSMRDFLNGYPNFPLTLQ